MPENKPAEKKKFELTMEMRMLIAFALMGAVFLLTPYITGSRRPAPKATQKQSAPAAAEQTPAAATPAPARVAPAAAPAAGTVAATQAESFTVDTDMYRVVFSNEGATVKSWQLKKYNDTNGKPVELVNAAAAPTAGWVFSYVFPEGQHADLNKALFVRKPSEDPLVVAFEYSDGKTTARKTFRFTKSLYRFTLASQVAEGGATVPHLLAWRGGFGDRTIHNAAAAQHSVHYDSAASKLIVQDSKAAKNGPLWASGTFNFGGLEDTYFAWVVQPAPGGGPMDVQTWSDSFILPGEKDATPHVGAAIGMGSGQEMSAFVGPKDVDILHSLDPKLESLIDWGWFRILAEPLFKALKWVNDELTNNWGWAIIVVTIIINFLLLPLRFSSIRSMQRMQALQPEVQKINDKYKGVGLRDPKMQHKNEELMALYQKHGINPMGGCVPMLLQMPFFFAFFKVLSVAIALRGAHWLWVTDLSQPELNWLRILPILMIVTQVIMQKMTPATSPDPTQQRMMMIMPLMLGFLFYSASAGLVLYWLTGNVVGIFQQFFFNRYAKSHVPVAVLAPTPKKKKG